MKLTSMQIDKAEREEQLAAIPDKDSGPAYPYGLEVRLGEESIEKLGLGKLPAANSKMILMAEVSVTETADREVVRDGAKKRDRSLCLQITALGLDTKKKTDDGALAGKLYTEGKSE